MSTPAKPLSLVEAVPVKQRFRVPAIWKTLAVVTSVVGSSQVEN